MPTVVQAYDSTWSPLSQQFVEPDTTFLLDPTADANLGYLPGINGLIPGNISNPYSIVPGKYRNGIQVTSGNGPGPAIPCDGLVGASEFTIELWASCTFADWGSIGGGSPMLTVGGSYDGNYLNLGADAAGLIKATLSHGQNPASTSGYTLVLSKHYNTGTHPANTFIHLALTLVGGTLTLYIDGAQQAQQTGVLTPAIWSGDAYKRGLYLGWSGFIVSDLRISRKARTPGQSLITAPSGRSLITVAATGSGTVQKLNGALHPPTSTPAEIGSVQALQAGATPGLSVIRTDKLLNTTPIVAGATDATHPTAGHSGSYSYDWQVVDRSVGFIVSQGCEPYISLDGVPQILGGSTPPYTNTPMTTSASAQTPDATGTITFTSTTGIFGNSSYFGFGGNVYTYAFHSGNSLTGVQLLSGVANLSIPGGSTVNVGSLTTVFSSVGGYAAGPPSAANMSAFATICADLVYHLTVEKGWTINYWGLWNEPDGSGFWENNSSAISDYLTLYGAVAPAVKAISASLKLGGPEITSFSGASTWVYNLLGYCGTLQGSPTITAAAQAGGYSGTRTFNGSTAWFYKAVARNGSGNSLGSVEVSATPATGGSVLITLTAAPTGTATWDIYSASSAGGQTGASSLLASGIKVGTTTFTDTGQTLSTGAIPSSAAGNGVPQPDFISTHVYIGDLAEPAQVVASVTAQCATLGVPVPAFVNGEWAWTHALYGSWPFWQPHYLGPAVPSGFTETAVNYALNDWMAGWVAGMLIQMQQQGYVRAIYCDPASPPGGDSWDTIVDAKGVPQVAYNVFRLWQMTLGNSILSTTVTGPDVRSVVSKNTATGKVYVFLSSLHYRKDKMAPVLVNVSALSIADGTSVTAYMVDGTHSNAFDAQTPGGVLQTVSPPAVSGGQIGISLRPRAAALLVIG